MQGDLLGVVDVALAKRRCRRRVVAGIGNFLTPGWIVAESELILTAPRRLARLYQRHLPLQLLELPLDVPSIQVVQVWHERTHAAPLHRWFRRQLQQTVRDGG